jgi:alkylhydroperoxidase family enzyme
VTDEIWNAAADHFDERQLPALVLMIAFTNCANRINATIRHSLQGEIS